MAVLSSGIQVHESKFSLLMQDSDSGEEADTESWKKVGKPKKTPHSKESTGSNKIAQKNAKRRARKKKSRQPSITSDSNVALEREDSEEVWQRRHQEAADMEFHKNLEEAILNSMAEERNQEAREQELSQSTQKSSRNKKGTTLTLQELHRTTDFAVPVRSSEEKSKQVEVEEARNNSAFFDMIHASVQQQTERDDQQKRRVSRHSSSSNSKGSVDLTNGSVEESARVAQLKDIAEKKEQEIAKLAEQNERLQCELQEVKKRNQVLCRILSQGEIATKSDLLKQIDELTSTKDDLTIEVEQLHSSLEQERSKNKQLRVENLKLQGSRGNPKH